jgi:hypothetical protein
LRRNLRRLAADQAKYDCSKPQIFSHSLAPIREISNFYEVQTRQS